LPSALRVAARVRAPHGRYECHRPRHAARGARGRRAAAHRWPRRGIVIEAAGAPDAVAQALDLARDGGRVVVCGQYTDAGTTTINPHAQLNRKHIEVHGCWGSDFSHLYRAVHIAARNAHRVPWRDMIGATFGLAQAGEALKAVENREVTKAVIEPGADEANNSRTLLLKY
jgi:threonine dehydrogenase-like Zn-dependent dehydrogenase